MAIVTDELALNYHLMHPGDDSAPGDPNLAYYLDGTCHLHYILRHPWRGGPARRPDGAASFSFIHVTSPDMLHWTWQTTKLKRFGVRLFADDRDAGLLVLLRPETGTLCVGDTEAPFAVAELPAGEDVELRIFVDKYLVEVFANGRQAALSACMGYRDGGAQVRAYLFGGSDKVAPTTFRSVEIWKLTPTNRGFFEARENRIWQPDTR